MLCFQSFIACFFFNDTATTEIYTLSLHDAFPILTRKLARSVLIPASCRWITSGSVTISRSEGHTSELQSPFNLVSRLLPEKKLEPPRVLQTLPTRLPRFTFLESQSQS